MNNSLLFVTKYIKLSHAHSELMPTYTLPKNWRLGNVKDVRWFWFDGFRKHGLYAPRLENWHSFLIGK